jgi:hypothetical protein
MIGCLSDPGFNPDNQDVFDCLNVNPCKRTGCRRSTGVTLLCLIQSVYNAGLRQYRINVVHRRKFDNIATRGSLNYTNVREFLVPSVDNSVNIIPTDSVKLSETQSEAVNKGAARDTPARIERHRCLVRDENEYPILRV